VGVLEGSNLRVRIQQSEAALESVAHLDVYSRHEYQSG
jgi:hypothetical protein